MVIWVLLQRISLLVVAHFLSRGPEQPLDGGLGLLGLRPGKVNHAVHLPELLGKQRKIRTQQASQRTRMCICFHRTTYCGELYADETMSAKTQEVLQ